MEEFKTKNRFLENEKKIFKNSQIKGTFNLNENLAGNTNTRFKFHVTEIYRFLVIATKGRLSISKN